MAKFQWKPVVDLFAIIRWLKQIESSQAQSTLTEPSTPNPIKSTTKPEIPTSFPGKIQETLSKQLLLAGISGLHITKTFPM
jgi:hypothetical protein